MCSFYTFIMSMFNRGRSQFLLLRHDCGCSRKLKSGGHAGWLPHLFTTLTSSLQNHNSQFSILKFQYLNFQFLIFNFLIFNSRFSILYFQFSILAGFTSPKYFFSNKDWILPKEKQPMFAKFILMILQLRFPLFWLAISKIITDSVISVHMDRS